MASTNIIADLGTVYTNGPSAATSAKAIAAAGPIMDYPGMVAGNKLRAQYCSVLLNQIKTDTDAGSDGTNLALLNKLLAVLLGTSTPSTTCIADINTVISNGPSAATLAKASAAAGPIMDYQGNTHAVRRIFQELKVFITIIVTDTDAGSDATNLGLLNGILQVLV